MKIKIRKMNDNFGLGYVFKPHTLKDIIYPDLIVYIKHYQLQIWYKYKKGGLLK